uniref:Uncharacterized protein n=1 Tax=Oryza nivara TaxID=4536 RepID=A0A0E0GZS5_ORYNI
MVRKHRRSMRLLRVRLSRKAAINGPQNKLIDVAGAARRPVDELLKKPHPSIPVNTKEAASEYPSPP